MQTQIGCPDCGNLIPVDTKLLLSGQSFMCARCSLSVSLALESRNVVHEAVRGFERLVTMKDEVGDKAAHYFNKPAV